MQPHRTGRLAALGEVPRHRGHEQTCAAPVEPRSAEKQPEEYLLCPTCSSLLSPADTSHRLNWTRGEAAPVLQLAELSSRSRVVTGLWCCQGRWKLRSSFLAWVWGRGRETPWSAWTVLLDKRTFNHRFTSDDVCDWTSYLILPTSFLSVMQNWDNLLCTVIYGC